MRMQPTTPDLYNIYARIFNLVDGKIQTEHLEVSDDSILIVLRTIYHVHKNVVHEKC